MRRALLATSWVLALASLAPRASAQTPEELFEQGRAAMEAKDFATACPALRRSFEASDSKGALYHLARCEDEGRAGRLATSLSLWRLVAPRFAEQPDIAAEAAGRISALDAKVARLRVRPAAGAPGELQIELDGVRVAVDQAIAVDAGRHAISATAPGRAAQRVEVSVGDGETRSVEIDAGGRLSVRDEQAPGPSPAPARPPPAPPERAGSGLTTAGWIAGGVGLAGLGLFALSAAIVTGAESDLDEACPSRSGCGQDAVDAADRGEAWLVPNAVGLGVGVIGVGLGVTLLVLGSSDDGVAATARPGGLDVRGTF